MKNWPCETWQELEIYKKKNEQINEKIKKEKQKINEHFNDSGFGYTEWIEQCFDDTALMQGAANLLIKHSYCEKCAHYLGPNPIHRKLYNISVLSCYCMKHSDFTTPDFRCSSIDFDPLWKEIMEMKLSKLKPTKNIFAELFIGNRPLIPYSNKKNLLEGLDEY